MATDSFNKKPFSPRVAAATQYANGRSPNTPKLASQPLRPSPRRPLSTPSPASDKSFSTPVKNISPNVTPRSSARLSRAESAHPTPTGTPTQSTVPNGRIVPKQPSQLETGDSRMKKAGAIAERSHSDLNRVRSNQDVPNKNGSTAASSPSVASSSINPEAQGSYFFFANEAGRPKDETRPKISPDHKKSPSFVYANGQHIPHTYPSTNGSALSRPNDSSTTSANKDLPNYRPGAGVLGHSSSPPLFMHAGVGPRSASPPKKPQSSPISQGPASPPLGLPSIPNVISSSQDRRTSEDSCVRTHKAPSFSSVDSGLGNASRPRPISIPQAPASPDDGSNSVSDAAANARRERKVLDLEISNSSLLAINRSLEKEVKRQKTELRRMRRMSRNSTFGKSLASNVTFRTVSGATSDLVTNDDLDAVEEDDDDLIGEDLESSDGTSLTSEPTSPSAIAQNDARHRKSDQRRLKQDLDQHKELLADSQKMNYSLKKCLGVTDQLIKDGKKALDHEVWTSDIHLGGRVLSRDDEREDEEAQGPG